MIPLLVLVAVPARGAEVTRVVSAMDGENRFDFNLTASWIHDVKSALVKRELQSGLSPRSTELIKDSTSRRRATSSTCAPTSASSGTSACTSTCRWSCRTHPASTSIAARRTASIPRAATGRPTCVDSSNSTVLRDGILPGYQADSWGLDAQHNRPYSRAPGEVPGPGEPLSGAGAEGLRDTSASA